MTLFVQTDGDYVARFAPAEAAALHRVMVEVVSLLSDGFDRADPVVERLFPDVYPDDPAGSTELRRYTDDDLKAGKLDQAGAVLATLPADGGQVRLDAEQAEAWLRALTDARLALGLRLDIRDDTDVVEELDDAVMRDPTSARVNALSVYEYLTYVQLSLLEAVIGE